MLTTGGKELRELGEAIAEEIIIGVAINIEVEIIIGVEIVIGV